MAEIFLHGVEVIEIDTGPRPIRTVRSSVIGIVGTAPEADPTAFPLNTPVLIAGSRAEAAKLDMSEAQTGEGTLPAALDGILDQIGAVVVVVRVEEGATEAETLANILGGVNALDGQYEGVHALLAAESVVGYSPRVLCAPGFTHQRAQNGIVNVTRTAGGSGYTNGVHRLTVTGGTGTGAQIDATVVGGVVTTVTIVNPGSGYTTDPTIAMPGSAGAGTGATFTVTRGTVGNAVVAELVGIAERLRAVIISDGPNTTDAAVIAYAGDFGSPRVYVVDPWVLVANSAGALVAEPASARVAGLIAKIDNDRGFWWSPSNQTINGIVGTARAVDFKMGDANSRANLLNEQDVATIIRQDGYRLWGNRTLSSDPKWAFLSVRRTADMLNDSLQRAHLWAVDRNITKTYLRDVEEGVNAYIRSLVAQGALIGGRCWADPDLNSAANIADGKVFFNFDFSAPYPAEHITFRSILTLDYLEELI
ncbi:phage tail sheath subtilisin-like domain-containing protein [Paracoccus aestuariivivens]|uniref:Phage tail protein n=1 Tax=Paracoccus aestuariivivens TaxID=1820333 RepID=A0A6L6JDS9_9RHOB|nr:phage tail sheath subtilisin-like domain-containing protein [Paracoccus aestuariivivens]MTH78757.1 phage tail protein [Paracoccus aestuariivivens]